MHGQSHFSKKTEYAKQLLEKQKARLMFGLTEKQFHNYYKKAESGNGVTGEELLRLLERRLDNVIYRTGFAKTRAQARQMVGHGLFKMNGRRITIPSIQVKIGDKVEIRTKNANSPIFESVKAGKEKIKPPSWLKAEAAKLTLEVVALPEKDDLEQLIQSSLIVEFYSKS